MTGPIGHEGDKIGVGGSIIARAQEMQGELRAPHRLRWSEAADYDAAAHRGGHKGAVLLF